MVDDRLIDIPPLPEKVLRQLGMEWFLQQDGYLIDELIRVSDEEIRIYADACSELYSMYEHGVQYVINQDLWKQAGIPPNAIDLIRYSWENRHQHFHLYGRFDLTGVIDGKPPKLIEFNADTATVVAETALIQAEQLRISGRSGARQFNQLIDHLAIRFRQLLQQNPEKEATLLLSTLGHTEDRLNAEVIAMAAARAGMEVQFLDLDQVIFSAEDGIFVDLGSDEFLPFDFWFKLVPWEFIAYEEPKLMDLLTHIVRNDRAVILNPAYTMLMQSKAMLKILWDLYPGHSLLLETAFSPDAFRNRAHVEKVIYGREGENIRIFDFDGSCSVANSGDFAHYPRVYQLFEELPRDSDKDYYQAGIYYTNQASALSFRRRDGFIVDADAEFVGHYI